jgi:hypothetical protein
MPNFFCETHECRFLDTTGVGVFPEGMFIKATALDRNRKTKYG